MIRFGTSARFVFLLLAGLLSALGVLGVLGGYSVWQWDQIQIRSFAEVQNDYRPSDVWILDRMDRPIESLRLDKNYRSLDWVQLSEVSPAFIRLLLESEDRRFYDHWGVDFQAMGGALVQRLRYGSQRGASTLSMQTFRLLEKVLQNSTSRDLAMQKSSSGELVELKALVKWKQILGAFMLELKWTKAEILEAYVNLVPFRGEIVGLRAAALGYFSKGPKGLVDREAAFLAALIRSPNAEEALVVRRVCRALQKNSDCVGLSEFVKAHLGKPYIISRARELLPVFSAVLQKNVPAAADARPPNPASADAGVPPPAKSHLIKTTLDLDIQARTLATVREQLGSLRAQNVKDAAAIVLDTKSGEILAYVANGGPGFSSSAQVDGIQAKRQAGSTLKPFIYASGFDWNLLTPDTLIDDSPADITIATGKIYRPRNYDNQFRGAVTVADALGSSLNVPAVRSLQLIGLDRVYALLQNLGFADLEEQEFYGPALALGAVDVSLMELAKAYQKIALKDSVENQFKLETRKKIAAILSRSDHRRYTFGRAGILSLPFPAAVKTGTSKDMRDNWCLGWTDQYLVAVWVGNFQGEPMWNVSGVDGAAPIWRNLMLALHPSHASVTLALAEAEPNFLKDASEDTLMQAAQLSRIRYPPSQMLVAIDPDIPKEVQKLAIEVEGPQQKQKLFLNNKLLSMAQESILWSLVRGKHKLELRSAAGKVLDRVDFEVR